MSDSRIETKTDAKLEEAARVFGEACKEFVLANKLGPTKIAVGEDGVTIYASPSPRPEIKDVRVHTTVHIPDTEGRKAWVETRNALHNDMAAKNAGTHTDGEKTDKEADNK